MRSRHAWGAVLVALLAGLMVVGAATAAPRTLLAESFIASW